MCGHAGYHGHHGYAEWCCCGPGFAFRRHFPSREERITRLEEYLKNLQAEAKAVEERIAELKAAG